eukprot:6112155-Amphidinium_carterae.1
MERIAEVENLKSAMADMIKESRNQNVLLSGTTWTQKPPDGLKEFIDQVDVSEADGLAALVMAATSTLQEVVPTNLAIFNDVEVPSLRVAAPVTPVRSTTFSEKSSFLASSDRRVNKTPFGRLDSLPEVAVRAGRVHVSPASDGGEDGGKDDSTQQDGPRDPWHGKGSNDPWGRC